MQLAQLATRLACRGGEITYRRCSMEIGRYKSVPRRVGVIVVVGSGSRCRPILGASHSGCTRSSIFAATCLATWLLLKASPLAGASGSLTAGGSRGFWSAAGGLPASRLALFLLLQVETAAPTDGGGSSAQSMRDFSGAGKRDYSPTTSRASSKHRRYSRGLGKSWMGSGGLYGGRYRTVQFISGVDVLFVVVIIDLDSLGVG